MKTNSPNWRRPWLLVLITLWALALRLGMGVYLGFNSPPDGGACGADTVEFERMAWSAAQGGALSIYPGGQPTAFRAPGYPLMLTGLYRLFGRTYFINRLVLSLVGAATCVLVYVLCLRLGLSRATANVGAFLTAMLPLQVYWCGHFMSEPLAAFFNVAGCVVLLGRRSQVKGDKTKAGGPFAAGILFGMAALTRPAAILVPPLLAGLWAMNRRVTWRQTATRTALLVLGMAIVIAPWSIRNRVALGRWSLIATNGGSTFWGANNEVVAAPGRQWGGWVSTNVHHERKEREVRSLQNEVDRDRKEWEIGREYVIQNPGKVPVLLLGKFIRLLTPFPQSANRIYVIAAAIGQMFLLPAFLAGLILILRDPDARWRFTPINTQLLVLLVTTAVFYGSERFRAPYEPLMAVYAAVAVAGVWRMATKRRCIGVEGRMNHGDTEARRNQRRRSREFGRECSFTPVVSLRERHLAIPRRIHVTQSGERNEIRTAGAWLRLCLPPPPTIAAIRGGLCKVFHPICRWCENASRPGLPQCSPCLRASVVCSVLNATDRYDLPLGNCPP